MPPCFYTFFINFSLFPPIVNPSEKGIKTHIGIVASPVVVVLLFYVNNKHLRSCWDGQLT